MPKGTAILGIETSCDETSAAVVIDGRHVMSNVISSQIDIHKEYGGVVPEIASRKHVELINYIIKDALKEADTALEDIDAIAVTYGPGLIGALLVGLSAAKGLAYACQKPLIGVHHIAGHISANYISHKELKPPFLCLVASGGHSHIVGVNDYGEYKVLGQTRDDAAGEAFDKVARILNLGYPGGPAIDKAARSGTPEAIKLPKTKFPGSYDFSFSGIKTAVINYIHNQEQKGIGECTNRAPSVSFSSSCIPDTRRCRNAPDARNFSTPSTEDICASFQKAIVDMLTENTVSAAIQTNYKKVCLAGGVAANTLLRKTLKEECDKNNLEFYCPEPILCTDNAAMIASAGYYEYAAGRMKGLDLNAIANLKI